MLKFPKPRIFGRPGKTSPRFIQDVLCYDPATPSGQGFNLLTDVPPVWEDANDYPEFVAPNHCPHRYLTKPNQTKLPQDISTLCCGNVFKVSAVCMWCRYHIELAITYTAPKQVRLDHLHHLVFVSETLAKDDPDYRFDSRTRHSERYYFVCSIPECTAEFSLKFFAPYLTPQSVRLLVDEHLLRERMEEALKLCPDRLEGISHPLPITVLATLKAYIDIALNEPERSRGIDLGNKRFTTSFGVRGTPCKGLLEFIGFKLKEDKNCWLPPNPVKSSLLPYHHPERIFLDDLSNELLALMKQRPEHEKEAYFLDFSAEAASTQFSYLLGSNNCTRDLGATEDMSSELIIEAYRNQVQCDPDRSSYYFKCLRSIGHWRGELEGKTIAEFIEEQYAEGKYADDDIPDAYRFFQLDINDRSLSDETIIGSFFARLEDSPNEAEPRRQLARIGDYRRSQAIKSVAEESVSDMQQALVFLGAEQDTPDDFIISMYAAKVDDMPATKELAKRALSLIAEERKSEHLRYFLRTGDAQSDEMDIGEAYRLFQISDRTVDDDSILAAFQVFATEDPAQIETYRKALKVISDETQSLLLKKALGEDLTPDNFDLKEWPVGLRNIGNTCYLNSLLQFYFTVTPFRNMIFHFEKQKMELDDESLRRKKVGSRTVSRSEVERAQKFIRELRSLFKNMASSPTRCVTPSQELARLTLLSSSNEAAIRRKSLAEPNLPVYGPFLPPDVDLDSNAGSSLATRPIKGQGSEDSEATLVPPSDPSSIEIGIDNKENVQPQEPGAVVESTAAAPANGPAAAQEGSTRKPMNPPDRPPPVPPRPVPDSVKKELEIGAQQDVTEVINNVLFQAQCAVKPEGYDADGGQLDIVTELFYGKTKSYITTSDGVRCKEEPWSDIKVDVARQSSDIYSALDGAFDMQQVHIGGVEAEQHGTISKAPPILQIQIQRVQFDQVQMQSFKSNNHLELRETIYLDRYMDTPLDDKIHRKRQEKWRLKDELQRLEKRRDELYNKANQPLPEVFDMLGNKLQVFMDLQESSKINDDGLGVEESTIALVSRFEEATEDEILWIDKRIAELGWHLENTFAEDERVPYRLYAVFIHRGSASAGHYWIYIFDFEKKIWREYNDEQVLEIKKLSTIFAPETGPHSPSPYFLVYVNDPLKEKLTNPVCRAVRDLPSPDLPTNTVDPPPFKTSEEQMDRHARPPTREPVKGKQQPADGVAQQDLEMSDAPPSYEDVTSMNNKGMRNTRPRIQKQSSSHEASLEPAAGGSWAKELTDMPGAEW
ncbi:Ubiquitin carboxyl-terminal hydrolase family protein [Coccidioides posadasii C735 delta SOWgp]|uniref:ubiquitinyl hydrolase 1 n=1 Tax=Coccidioides posadasii (strain C735) TaxID=222929 RepID=C5PFN8_COCP7|nr:Ubiquitin carboxyl-terminal hydrolase family protein [Coccidioides posadasii C735 delta SOWgp]EER23341.1 Ubiquitin carboxyl-terminal hydrolase family protein [Coccidioides posadasii C735 delta SOWgp]|eukprot:XP_003065486.1 Ubiquitin carboxyl-terminal hydrolase family protein [Coccidioides posadasii C735 delta SOWgp]